MKVIDLLNKIANGEIDRNNKYQFSQDDYCTINDFFNRYIIDEENLNLEILEEEKKIPEKLNEYKQRVLILTDQNDLKVNYSDDYNNLAKTVNSIIDYLKSKGE